MLHKSAVLSPCRRSPCHLDPVAARPCVCWERVNYVHLTEARPGVEPAEVWRPAGTFCGAPRARWGAERRAALQLPPTRWRAGESWTGAGGVGAAHSGSSAAGPLTRRKSACWSPAGQSRCCHWQLRSLWLWPRLSQQSREGSRQGGRYHCRSLRMNHLEEGTDRDGTFNGVKNLCVPRLFMSKSELDGFTELIFIMWEQ